MRSISVRISQYANFLEMRVNCQFQKVPLLSGERVADAPVEKDGLRIEEDGTIEFTTPLNFEKQHERLVRIQINGRKKCKY